MNKQQIKAATQTRVLRPLPGVQKPLRIASWNLENFCGTAQPEKCRAVAATITDTLRLPHILALQEMMGDDCPSGTRSVSAQANAQALIDAIRAQSGVTYAYADLPPITHDWSGAAGALVRPGFLYRPDRVELRETRPGKEKPDASIDSAGAQLHLAPANPARLGRSHPAFSQSQRPLIAEFIDRENGEQYFVANLHFPSHAHPSPEQLKNMAPGARKDAQARVDKISEQASHVAGFLQGMREQIGWQGRADTAHIIALGDFNTRRDPARLESTALHTLETLGLVAADREQPAPRAVDHLFLSPALATRLEGLERPTLSGPRVSDHAPLLASIAPQRALPGPAGWTSQR